MDHKTPLMDIQVGDLITIIDSRVRDIPPDHFMAAVDKRLVTLGKELTGKDIGKNSDVLCMRKTFDNSQDCRIKKEKVQDVLITESVKKVVHWAATIILVAWVTFLKFGVE